MRRGFLESLVAFGCTVSKCIKNKQTDRQTDKQTFFFIYIDRWRTPSLRRKCTLLHRESTVNNDPYDSITDHLITERLDPFYWGIFLVIDRVWSVFFYHGMLFYMFSTFRVSMYSPNLFSIQGYHARSRRFASLFSKASQTMSLFLLYSPSLFGNTGWYRCIVFHRKHRPGFARDVLRGGNLFEGSLMGFENEIELAPTEYLRKAPIGMLSDKATNSGISGLRPRCLAVPGVKLDDQIDLFLLSLPSKYWVQYVCFYLFIKLVKKKNKRRIIERKSSRIYMCAQTKFKGKKKVQNSQG